MAKQIEREVGALLVYDKVLQKAVCPERKHGLDGAVSALASVTEVKISNDLQVAKVYLSIYSDDAGRDAAMAGLQRLEGYVRKHIGRQVRLRLTPEIRFLMDESIERSERVMKLLEQVKAIEAGEAPPPPITIAMDDDWGESYDDDDESDGEDGEGAFDGTVDLGIFDVVDDEEADEDETNLEMNEIELEDPKAGDVDLRPEDVEAMMALFRQESAAKGTQRRQSPPSGRDRPNQSRRKR